MRSVADDFRNESARMVAKLPMSERVALALRLGDQDVALYQAAHGISHADARRALATARHVGRRPSRSNDPAA
jgi:hypothetical protein